jgi:hypothetical protein
MAATLPAAAFDFDWGTIGWADGNTGPQSFIDVDGSGVDVTVQVSGNTDRFISGAPSLFAVDGNDELRSFLNLVTTSESVTFDISFSQPVTVEGLAVKDIDSAFTFAGGLINYSDAILIEGVVASGPSIPPTTVTVGSAVNTVSPGEYDSRTITQLDYPDPRGWVTGSFTATRLTALRITHFSGPTLLRNPSSQAITLSDFRFFTPDSDRGDAPVSYGDPRHNVPVVPTVFLGAPGDEPDTESPTPHSADARGDDDVGDDENGVVLRTFAGASPPVVEAVITITADQGTFLCAWLDLPDTVGGTTGVFDPAEGQCVSNSSTGTFERISIWQTAPGTPLSTYLRVRVSTAAIGPGDAAGAGSALPDGEVEDYQVVFDPTAVTLGDITLAATPVTDFLDGVSAPRMSAAQLTDMLRHWDAAALAGPDTGDRELLLDAMAAYLDPDGDGRVAVLAWETLEERGTVGFYAERREAGGPWQRINPRLLPGLITAPLGGEYRLADPGAASGKDYQYRLLEVEAQGWQREYGPFTLRLD